MADENRDAPAAEEQVAVAYGAGDISGAPPFGVGETRAPYRRAEPIAAKRRAMDAEAAAFRRREVDAAESAARYSRHAAIAAWIAAAVAIAGWLAPRGQDSTPTALAAVPAQPQPQPQPAASAAVAQTVATDLPAAGPAASR